MTTERVGVPSGERLEVGTAVGDYRIGDVLGHGGFATVYRASHAVIGKAVAIKVIRRAFAVDDAMNARFVREARAVIAIGHPNIVEVMSLGNLDDGRAYMVMELLEGETLEAHLAIRGRMAPELVSEVMRGVAAALEAAHGEGIVHRDLKPENIFLCQADGGAVVPKLLDFGIAKLLDEERGAFRTRTGAPIGTPAFMAPEQCVQLDVDNRTDVYNFGLVCFTALTGTPPFSGDSYLELMEQQTKAPRPRVSSRCPELGAGFDGPIAEMMAIEPDVRPATITEAWRRLEDAARERRSAGAAPTVPSLPSPAVRGETPRAKPRRWAIPVAGLALGSLVLASWWTRDRPSSAAPAPTSSGAVDVAAPPATAMPLRVGMVGPRAKLAVYNHSPTPSSIAMRHIVEPLMARRTDGQLEPYALESVVLSDDARSARLRLRSDLTFHAHPCLDGRERQADGADLVHSLEAATTQKLIRIPTEGAEEFRAGRATSIAGARAAQPRDVTLTFSRPAPLVEEMLAQVMLIPKELRDCPVERIDDFRWPVGTGAFKATGPLVDANIELARHDGHRSSSGATVRGLTLVPIDDATAGLSLVRKGELDLAVAPAFDAAALVHAGPEGEVELRDTAAEEDVVVVEERVSGVVDLAAIVPMFSKKGPLHDARVRRAIAHAVDRHEIAQAYPMAIVPFARYFPPGLMGDLSSSGFDRDPERASALLAEAGYAGGAGLPSIAIGTTPTRAAALGKVAEQLAAIGIEVRQEILTRSDFERVLDRHLLDALLLSIHLPTRSNEPYPFMLGLLESYEQRGPRGLELAEVVEAVQQELRAGERAKLYEQFERLALEQAVVVPLGYLGHRRPMFVFFARPGLTGLDRASARAQHLGSNWFAEVQLADEDRARP